MYKLRNYILILLIVTSFVSCEKFKPGDCFKNAGEITSIERELDDFKYLNMNNNVDVFLTYAPSYSVTVKAGKNIIPGIKTQVSNHTLTISNENHCNWVRSYEKPIEVYLSTPVLDSIVYQSSGNLISTNQFPGDSLKLDVLEGAGSIELWLDIHKLIINLSYGTADLNVKGYAHLSYLYSAAYGPADLSSLETVYTFMTNNSTNICRVRSSLGLDVNIFNVGDVYYSGNPQSISTEITGTGKLIKE